jgi:hypothetical protein
MLGSDSGIITPLPSLPQITAPKPNASNMHTTSVETKAAYPKPQQPRNLVFRVHFASVFTGSADSNDSKQQTIKNTGNLSQITLVRT